MNRGGFSWKKFIGISAAKARISRKIGIPLTKSGRDQKIGRMITWGGCVVILFFPLAISACAIIFFC
jgi:hypothetical protein